MHRQKWDFIPGWNYSCLWYEETFISSYTFYPRWSFTAGWFHFVLKGSGEISHRSKLSMISKYDCNKFFMSAILPTFKCDFILRQNEVKINFSLKVEINVNSVWNWKFPPKQTFTCVGALSHWDFYIIMCNRNTFNHVSVERHVISNAVSLQLQ